MTKQPTSTLDAFSSITLAHRFHRVVVALEGAIASVPENEAATLRDLTMHKHYCDRAYARFARLGGATLHTYTTAESADA